MGIHLGPAIKILNDQKSLLAKIASGFGIGFFLTLILIFLLSLYDFLKNHNF